MTIDDIRNAVVDALTGIAPEIDAGRIDPHADLRREYGLDSMDVLNLAIGVHERLGVNVPEADYGRLSTLDAAVAYLASTLGVRSVS